MSPSNQSFDIEVAFPCDIDLQWYLVPKTWVRMQLIDTLVAKLGTSINAAVLDNELLSVRLESACRRALGLLTVTAGDVKVIQGLQENIQKHTAGIVNFHQIFEKIVERPMLLQKDTRSV